ncbi:MAG: heme A synthase [Gammaproteobacteria bacterium]|nr:heme A synthase [Gammaproteobacteria bacterium]
MNLSIGEEGNQASMPKSSDWVRVWLIVVCLVLVAMITVGGATRLTHSGLSMVDWKPLSGVIPPITTQEWEAEFDQYKQFPEYQKLNQGMDLAEFKQIFYWEYGHRVLGRLIGLMFFVPFVFFWLTKRVERKYVPRLVGALILGGSQGLMGWYMVKSGLVDIPRVSHYRLAAHLSLAMLILCYLSWLIFDLSTTQRVKVTPLLKKLITGFVVLLSLQIIYGAFTAGLRAGLGFNTYPLMGQQLLADAATTIVPFWINLFENGAMVQFIHRWLGFLVLLSIITVFAVALSQVKSRRVSQAATWVLGLVLVQFLLGVLTLINYVPLYLALAHQVFACLVLLGAAYLLYIVRD